MKNKKKKKKFNMIYVYIGIFVLIIAAFIAIGQVENNKDKASAEELYGVSAGELNPATRALLNDENYQNIILPDELDQKIENKEDFFVYMFSASCIYCKETTPVIMPLVNELAIDFPQFNLLEYPTYMDKYAVEYTPTILYFKEGVEVDRLEGGVTTNASAGNTIDDFRGFFEKHMK